MTKRSDGLRRFLVELKRRKVYQVTAVYVVAAIAGLEIISVVVPATRLPEWSDELFLALAIVGLPLAIVLAWAFDITPGGVRWTEPEDEPTAVVTEGEGATTASTGAAAPAVAEDGLDERTVAVLPFENLSGSADADPFAAGLHDDVLTELSRVPGLTVISRTSVKRYAGSSLTIPDIGKELGAGTIVEGGVQAAAGRVRLNVQLIDARTDQHRWAERFDRALTTETMFEMQSELAERIATTLHARLADSGDDARGPRTEDLEAYRLHARGRQHFAEYTPEGMRRAVELFEEATERDPSYAIAWADLGTALIHLGEYKHMDAEDAFARGEDALRRALTLDPHLAEAHTAYGNLYSARRDAVESRAHHERAIALRPGYAAAHKWLGWATLLTGDAATAVRAGERARALDPLDAEGGGNLAWAYLGVGETDRALAEARRTAALHPDFDYPIWTEALVLFELGRAAEGCELLEDMTESWAERWPATSRALTALRDGRGGDAEKAADGMADFHRGIVLAAAGRPSEAIEAIAAGAPWPWDETLFLRYAPGPLAGLKEDPRFARVMDDLDRSWGLGA